MLFVGTLFAGYVAMVGLLYLMQDSVLFPGASWGRGQPLPSVQGVSVQRLALADGKRIRCARCAPAESPAAVVLWFLGNGEDLRSGVQWAGELTGFGVAAVVPEYPGYGDSDGKPSHESLIAAAEVAAEHAARWARELGVPLLVGGNSLGTFCATHVAARGVAERLLLLAPPTSVADVGSRRFPWLPVRWLNRNPFDNLAAAAEVRCPTMVLHGDVDRVVPWEMGRQVADAIAGESEFLLAPDCGHTRAPLHRHRERVRAFLRP